MGLLDLEDGLSALTPRCDISMITVSFPEDKVALVAAAF